MEKEEIELKHTATLFYRLYNNGKWDNKGHMPIENAVKGFPKHLRGDIKKLIENLVKKGFLAKAKHNYGEGISLRMIKLNEIEEIIEKYH
ncbi:MAG: hypothetical protein KKH98_03995 [Spirochaetes bacterium]|nr:hypothetical protein [Spirochaetota bacterium]